MLPELGRGGAEEEAGMVEDPEAASVPIISRARATSRVAVVEGERGDGGQCGRQPSNLHLLYPEMAAARGVDVAVVLPVTGCASLVDRARVL